MLRHTVISEKQVQQFVSFVEIVFFSSSLIVNLKKTECIINLAYKNNVVCDIQSIIRLFKKLKTKIPSMEVPVHACDLEVRVCGPSTVNDCMH